MSDNSNSHYPSYGMPLKDFITRPLILEELGKGFPRRRQDLVQSIYSTHLSRGGMEMESDKVTGALKKTLSILIKDGLVERPAIGWYKIAAGNPLNNNYVELSIASDSPIINTMEVEHTSASLSERINSGVYVYSYPSYMPEDKLKGVGLYKIGASTNIDGRVYDQGRQTEVPEDLEILRRFHSEDPRRLETAFHRILKAADMQHKTAKGGTEWFRCTLALIDAIAEAIKA